MELGIVVSTETKGMATYIQDKQLPYGVRQGVCNLILIQLIMIKAG